MLNTCSGTHCLNIALSDHLGIAHIILMFKIAVCWNGNDLHIIMRMCAKTHPASNRIIIQNSQGSKMNSFRIIIIGETKTMITIKPAMICMTPCICFMKNGFHDYSFLFFVCPNVVVNGEWSMVNSEKPAK